MLDDFSMSACLAANSYSLSLSTSFTRSVAELISGAYLAISEIDGVSAMSFRSSTGAGGVSFLAAGSFTLSDYLPDASSYSLGIALNRLW